MKTIEDLKGMTHEDLVAYVQDLEISLEKEKKEHEKYQKWWQEEQTKHSNFLDMMKKMLNLMQ